MFKEIAIIGTTASGKTNIAFEVAKNFNAIILSLDSLSVYKEINIASAKPKKEILETIKHFGIDLVYPDMDFNIGDFIDEYEKSKTYAIKNNVPLIITGGSSFYLKSMLTGLAPKIDDVNIDITDDEIYKLMENLDSNFASKFSQNDKFRLHKWYSIYKTTGLVPSQYLENNTKEPCIKNLKIFEILWEKNILEKRIFSRTKQMVDFGLIKEAKYLFEKYDKNSKSLNSIGLKECKEYLDNKISLDKLIELISIHTRQLAKRQRTFNKSQFGNKIIYNNEKEAENQINSFLLKN